MRHFIKKGNKGVVDLELVRKRKPNRTNLIDNKDSWRIEHSKLSEIETKNTDKRIYFVKNIQVYNRYRILDRKNR